MALSIYLSRQIDQVKKESQNKGERKKEKQANKKNKINEV